MSESLPLEDLSMSRRQLLNFLTGAVVVTTASTLLYPVAKFFVPPTEAGEARRGIYPHFSLDGN